MGENLSERTPGGLLASDTAPEVERIQVARWREMSPLEKARMVAEATATTRKLSFAGIRLRHPSASEDECRLYYALITLGQSLACKAYPEARSLVAL